jgi:rubrerythrin
MRKEGFELHSYPEENGEFSRYIKIVDLIEKQRAETTRILSEVVDDLRNQERIHREQFRSIKLMRAFNQVGYAFEKILEELRPSGIRVLSAWGVNHLQDSLDEFEKLLI